MTALQWAKDHRAVCTVIGAGLLLAVAGTAARCARPAPLPPKVEDKKLADTSAKMETDVKQEKVQKRAVKRAPVVKETFGPPPAPGGAPVLLERTTVGAVEEVTTTGTDTVIDQTLDAHQHVEEQHTVTPVPDLRPAPLAFGYTAWFESVGLPAEHTVSADVPVRKVPFFGFPLRAGVAVQLRPNGEKNIAGPLKMVGLTARIEFGGTP